MNMYIYHNHINNFHYQKIKHCKILLDSFKKQMNTNQMNRRNTAMKFH